MRIGFACLWDRDAPATWSGTPFQLRAAMRRRADVVDVGVRVPLPVRRLLQAAHLTYRDGELMSLWEQGSLTDRYCSWALRRAGERLDCDAVLQMQDLAVLDRPFYLYQDMSFDALLKLEAAGVATYRVLRPAELRRRRERQLRLYERSAGVLAMSRWLADSLVRDTGLPPERVHVVHPGRTAGQESADRPPADRDGPRRRLLFVGRTFESKGGDLALAALAVLRREVDPEITLTVVGPSSWPAEHPMPEGVRFLGALPTAQVARLYDEHDLFVLPSRIEGFGIVFAEALARGLPCIGRDDFAMPEIIQAPKYGALLSRDDAHQLAELIAKALADDALYDRCRQDAAATAEYYSWDRAAHDAIRALS